MKTKKKRLLGILLSLALLLGLLPGMSLTAFADGNVASVTVGETTTNYETLTDAVTAWNSAASGSTLTLLADVTMANTINVSGTKILDLNGYGIKKTGSGRVLMVTNGANMTLHDSNATRTDTGSNRPDGVSGGYITGGYTQNESGSCVRVENGSVFNMYGGSITGNRMNNGGGAVLVIGGSFNMYGGSITGNTTDNNCGGVWVHSKEGSTFNMYCGTITDNTLYDVNAQGVMTTSSNATIGGFDYSEYVAVTFDANGGTGSMPLQKVRKNTDTTIFANVNCSASGISDPAFSREGYDFAGWNTQADGEGTNYTAGTSTINISEATTLYAQWTAHVASVTTSGGTTTEYTTFADALGAWADGATLTLLSDVTTSTINASGTKTLDLNEHTLSGDGNGSVIFINGATLTVNDGTITGGTGGKAYGDSYKRGGAVDVKSGTITLNNCTINGNTADYGSAIFMAAGVLNITGSTSIMKHSGTAIWIQGATVNMDGGTISNNGTGVRLFSSNSYSDIARLNISGGRISENGYGVSFGGDQVGHVSVSGNAVIANNTGSNLSLRNEKISIADALGDDASIGVTMQTPGVFTDSTNTSFNDASKFVSDNASYAVGKNSSGQLFLAAPVTVTFDINGHGNAPSALTVASGSAITAPAAPTETGYTFDGWYTEATCANAWDFTNDTVTADTTLYAKWTLNTYAVTFDANGGAGAMEEQTVSHNAAAVLTANTFTRAGCNFAGWNTGADGTGTPYADGASVTLTAPLTLYAQWTTKPVYTASGTVKQESDNAPISGATVRLVQGERKLAVTATNDDGAFSFSAPDGIYNIVAEHGGKTRTELVTLRADQQVHIVMPSASVNSVLMVTGDDTPNVMVGGLDELAEQIGAQGASVTVTMTVEKKDENAAVGAERIKYEADGMSLDYLDISLTETVSSTESPPTPTDRVLEIVVPYDFSKKKQTTVAVYRYHDGSAAPLAESNTRADGTYRLDKDNNLVYIYANRFSTYAIGFTPTYAVSGTLNFGSFTGAVSFSLAGNSIQKTASSTVTNGEGSYSFTGVPAGTYDMTASWNEDGKAQTLTFTVMVPAGTP